MWALLLTCVKSIFALIDSMVAFVIEYLYQLIIAIADTNVFGNLIYHYLGRIYTFLGIFMVFKLSISMINYIINPDSLTDKGKGFGKLISNVIISLILLVATPTLFEVAFDIQTDLLKTNAVYQIVTGKKLNNDASGTLYENAKTTSKTLSYNVFDSFIYEDEGSGWNSDRKGPARDKDGNICKDTNCLLEISTVNNDDNKYWWLLSTGVGLVVAYILLVFCFDIAMRSVKLGFLQIVAPIPIMLRMDPGAKDDKFSKWLKEVSSTFLSLFIRLAGLFFVMEIIGLIMDKPGREAYGMFETYSGASQSGLLDNFAQLFIIVGCLMFAKKLPQLISDLFGIKLDGDGFSLKKKVGNIPGLGAAKMIGAGALGFAGGMAANAYAGIRGWDKNKGVLSNLNKLGNSTLAGGLSGAFRGATSKEKSMWKAAGAGISGAVDKRNKRDEWQATGNHLGKRTLGRINAFAGMSTDDSSKIKSEYDLGERLFKENKDNPYGFYKNSAFADAVRASDNAKSLRDSAQSAYEIAQMKFNNGDTSISAEQVNDLRVAAAKASATFDKSKAELDKQKTLYSDDAKLYAAYTAAEDRDKVRNAGSTSSTTTETKTSSSSSTEVFTATKETTVSTPSGGNVNVHQGEKVTKSGIILGNDSNWNKR